MSHENNASKDEANIQQDHDTAELENAALDDFAYDSFSDEIDGAADHVETGNVKDVIDQYSLKISTLENELLNAKDQMMRAMADAENARKRAAKDREDASKFAIAGFSRDLLSVADNLRRALDAAPQDVIDTIPQMKNLMDGIEATERELLRGFEKNGIKKIDPINERFDPNFHEVMFEAPFPDKENGTIIQVLEAGYTINERILRPARVGISKGGDEVSQTPIGESGHNLNTEV